MSRFLLVLVGLLAVGTVAAQPTPPIPPTPPEPPRTLVFSPAALDALFSRPPRVEVNLRGALLRLAAQASADDPETAAMMRGLRGVTVRVYNLDTAHSGLREHLTRIGDAFGSSGWDPLVRVRGDEDGDDVFVFVRTGATLFEGLAVAAVDSDDGTVSFVHIDGLIDPSKIGSLGSRFGGVDIDAARREAELEMEGIDVEAIRLDAEREADAVRREIEAEMREDAEAAREDARRAREAARSQREEARAQREAARAEAARARADAEAARKEAARP